jgi:hypothetical protein
MRARRPGWGELGRLRRRTCGGSVPAPSPPPLQPDRTMDDTGCGGSAQPAPAWRVQARTADGSTGQRTLSSVRASRYTLHPPDLRAPRAPPAVPWAFPRCTSGRGSRAGARPRVARSLALLSSSRAHTLNRGEKGRRTLRRRHEAPLYAGHGVLVHTAPKCGGRGTRWGARADGAQSPGRKSIDESATHSLLSKRRAAAATGRHARASRREEDWMLRLRLEGGRGDVPSGWGARERSARVGGPSSSWLSSRKKGQNNTSPLPSSPRRPCPCPCRPSRLPVRPVAKSMALVRHAAGGHVPRRRRRGA